jgi:hypothetical protein
MDNYFFYWITVFNKKWFEGSYDNFPNCQLVQNHFGNLGTKLSKIQKLFKQKTTLK